MIFFHPDTNRTAHRFETTRKGGEIATILEARGWQVHQPALLTRADIERYHSPQYVAAIASGDPQELACSQGFPWDAQMWDSVIAQCSAMYAACQVARSGRHAFALAAGFHHARHDHGAGFCTFNGIAIACGELIRNGVPRIAIIDVDAHHGGGTYSLVKQWPEVMHVDVSTNYYDIYRCASPHWSKKVDKADAYLSAIDKALAKAATHLRAGDLCIYNAGVDVYEHCTVGGLTGIDAAMIAERERRVVAWANTHHYTLAACLAGGYQGPLFPLDMLHTLHIQSITTIVGQTT